MDLSHRKLLSDEVVQQTNPLRQETPTSAAPYRGAVSFNQQWFRAIRAQGYGGGYTAVTDVLRAVRPPPATPFEVRFETPPGEQAQVDFAQSS